MKRAPVLRAGHWNVHKQTEGAELMMKLGLAFVGLNEGRGIVPDLRQLGREHDYRLQVAQGHPEQRSAWDTPILVRDKYPALGAGFQQISELVPSNETLAPDRIATWAGIAHPVGSVAFVELHLNAGPNVLRGNDPTNPTVREYAESVRSVDRLLTFLRGEYQHLLVGGDVNLPDDVDVPWSPYPMLRDNGLVVRSRHIDVLAHSRSLEPTTHQLRVIDKAKGNTDHPGLVGSYRARR